MRLQTVSLMALSLTALASATSLASQRPVAFARVGAVRNAHAGHLYVPVGTARSGQVLRYRLNPNGLPERNPDGMPLLLDFNPGGFAVGPDGSVYVSRESPKRMCGRLCDVLVFAPGATGHAEPVRVLYFSQSPSWLAVDARGYLDVGVGTFDGGGVTNVYAPDASGHDRPINVITQSGVTALAADARGQVYVQSLISGVSAVREYPSGGQTVTFNDGVGGNGLAVDATQLYATYVSGPNRHNAEFLSIDVFSLNGPGNPIRTIIATGCRGAGGDGAPPVGYGLAVQGDLLYEGCTSAPNPLGAVQVYDASRGGRQRPLASVPASGIGVAIGP